jgi:hypothetical protein
MGEATMTRPFVNQRSSDDGNGNGNSNRGSGRDDKETAEAASRTQQRLLSARRRPNG